MEQERDHLEPMLTGRQIRAAREMAGITRQAVLAELAGVHVATVQRAEAAGNAVPNIGCQQMEAIVHALESRGIEFILGGGASLAGGVGMRMR